ncbi:MAG: hypothetical protein JNK87_09085 [Bryobacterales bacterium]|nr:hypothetical protein [Bryobacterales bacterium]
MRRLMVAALLTAWWLPAQEQKMLPPPMVAKLVNIKHLQGRELGQALGLVRMFGVDVRESELGVIAINGAEAAVAAAEAALAKLDIPKSVEGPRNAEVVIWVVAASSKFQADSLTPALEPVIKQMRGIFQYPHYRILDTQIMRQRVNVPGGNRWKAELIAQVPNPAKEATYTCHTDFLIDADPAAKTPVFRFNNFSFRCYYPAQPTLTQAYMKTDVDVREGQKAVVGKSGIGDDSAIFLVLTARQLE